MSQPAQDKFTPVSIKSARVADVNVKDFTATVFSEDDYKRRFDVPFSVPYLHAPTGSGMHYLPEPGASCWCTQPADYGPMFIIGWYSPPSYEQGGGSRGFRRALEPGDMIMDGRDGNYVWVRRGGIVEVAATPICRRFYIPIDNLIRDVAGSYRLQTLGGAWEWSVARKSDDSDGRAPVNFAVGVKEFSDDSKVMVSLEMSNSVDGDPDNLLNQSGVVPSEENTSDRPAIKLRIYNPADGFAEVVSYVFDKKGNVDISFQGRFNLTVAEQIVLASSTKSITLTTKDPGAGPDDKSIQILSAADMLLEAKEGRLSIDVGSLLISTKDGVKVSGGSVLFETDVTVNPSGGGAVQAVVLEQLVTYVLGHTHPLIPPAPLVVGTELPIPPAALGMFPTRFTSPVLNARSSLP